MHGDIKIKNGMAGSNCGKGRREPTEVLKKVSKKRRRRSALYDVADALGLSVVRGPVSGKLYLE